MLEPDEAARVYQQELNSLIEVKSKEIGDAIISGDSGSIFEEAYNSIATSMVALTNTYVSLRIIEDILIRNDG